jgi:hypothetical protein
MNLKWCCGCVADEENSNPAEHFVSTQLGFSALTGDVPNDATFRAKALGLDFPNETHESDVNCLFLLSRCPKDFCLLIQQELRKKALFAETRCSNLFLKPRMSLALFTGFTNKNTQKVLRMNWFLQI